MNRSLPFLLTAQALLVCSCASAPKGPLVVLEGERVRLELPRDVNPQFIDRYQWVQTSGPEVTLNDPSLPTPQFVAPNTAGPADLTFVLVTHSANKKPVSRTVSLKLSADDDPPSADAGDAQTVSEGQKVRLYGIGRDPEGEDLRFHWTQTSGPRVRLDNASSQSPSFTAPDVATHEYLNFRLVVSDQRHDSAPDEVTVSVQGSNKKPVADAGLDQTVLGGERVTLVGSGFDPDGDTLSYEWQLVSKDVNVRLGTPRAKELSFIAPPCPEGRDGYELVLSLTVTDGGFRSEPDEVVVSARQTNRAPSVTAPAPQTVGVGDLVQLSATGQDPDGDALTYRWRSLSDEPAVDLSATAGAALSFLAPECPPGRFQYALVLELVASDGQLDSSPVQTRVTVAALNQAPSSSAGLPRTVTEGEQVRLLGAGEDPEGATLIYTWKILTPGATFPLENANSQEASFEAPPCTEDAPYDLLFGLSVSDGLLSSPVDELRITVQPEARWGPMAENETLELFERSVSGRLEGWQGDLTDADTGRGFFADPETRGALGVCSGTQAEIQRSLPTGLWSLEGVLVPKDAGSSGRIGLRVELGPDDAAVFGLVRSGEDLPLFLYRSTESESGWSDPPDGQRVLEKAALETPIYFSLRWTGSSLRAKWSQRDDLEQRPERTLSLPLEPRRVVLYGRDAIGAFRSLKLESGE